MIVAVDINEAHLTVAALGVTHTVNAKTHNLADLLRLPVLVLDDDEVRPVAHVAPDLR